MKHTQIATEKELFLKICQWILSEENCFGGYFYTDGTPA